MALSGSLTKKYFYSNTHCHWIEWSATQNIATNQSTVTVAFKSTWTSGFGVYSEKKNINQIRFNGTNYSRSTSITGSVGTVTQFTTTRVITHNADGTATFKLGGRHRLNSSFADYVYWNDVTFTLNTIPRVSEITGFSNFNSDSTSISVTLDAKSTAFTHSISLSLGGTTIASWTGGVNGSNSFALSTAQRNALLDKLPTSTSGTATVTVVTKSGTTTIGTRTKTATYTILAGVKPTISGVSKTITTPTGAISGRSRSYAVQNISTVKISYSRAIPRGTTISAATVKLGAASSTGNPASFVPSGSGSQAITITVTDKRGRVGTYTDSISVVAYGGLSAQLIHAQRPQSGNDPQDTMQVRLRLTVPAITSGGSTTNAFNVTIRTVPVDGSSGTSTVVNQTYNPGSATSTLYNYSPSMIYLETKAYNVTIVVKDDFKTVTMTGKLSTASFPLVLGPDGIGIGKIPEAGRALDVQGPVYFDGIQQGIVESGSNENGTWIKWADGTQICYGTIPSITFEASSHGALYRSVIYYHTYPKAFLTSNRASVSIVQQTPGDYGIWIVPGTNSETRLSYRGFGSSNDIIGQSSGVLRYTAIGRWKA